MTRLRALLSRMLAVSAMTVPTGPVLAQALQPLPESAHIAARAWLDRQGIDVQALAALPVDERARRLTQAVYSYCEHGPQTVSRIEDLYVECSTACGGYSYVLRGLLEVTGARTRYVNLYNIPNQGNHTAVEVEVDGDWGFYDPTFGAYFTEDGTAAGPILSLSDVAAGLSGRSLDAHVRQARKHDEAWMEDALEALFSEPFEHPYMSLANYQLAEALSRDDANELVILDIALHLEDGQARLGAIDADGFEAAQSAWLTQTNALLNDPDLSNDISFNTSLLSNAGLQRMTLITLTGAEPGTRYRLRLNLFAPAATSLQISPLSRTAVFAGDAVIELTGGRTLTEAHFVASEPVVQFALRNLAPHGRAHLFGVEAMQ